MKKIVAISGPKGSGKTVLARQLGEEMVAPIISTADILRDGPEGPISGDRKLLSIGNDFDNATDGEWVVGHRLSQIGRHKADMRWDRHHVVVVDCVRSIMQWRAVQRAVGIDHATLVWIGGTSCRLERGEDGGGLLAEGEISRHAAYALRKEAIEVNGDTTTGDARAIAHRIRGSVADIVCGGQWGSEGKGQISAWLASRYCTLMRVGGPNAGHSVKIGGKKFVFHQLPSGVATNPGASVILACGCAVDVAKLHEEVRGLVHNGGTPPDNLFVDGRAVRIDREDMSNEAVLRDTIGSTAQGVGAARARRVMRQAKLFGGAAVDLENVHWPVLLEGTQGFLLSLLHGDYPYCTSWDCSAAGIASESGLPRTAIDRVYMVCRTHPIRVASPDAGGTSGPMPSETTWESVAKQMGVPVGELIAVERTTTTKRGRRVAHLTWDDFDRAIATNNPTDIALTFVDYLGVANRGASWRDLNDRAQEMIAGMEQRSGVPVTLVATGFGNEFVQARHN